MRRLQHGQASRGWEASREWADLWGGTTDRKSWNFSPKRRDYMSEVDDAGLLERARRGDEDAFSRLFARYQRVIYRF